MKWAKLNNTIGYEEFISVDLQGFFNNWIEDNLYLFDNNGPSRKFCVLDECINFPHQIIKQLRQQIIKLEKIKDWKPEPMFKDYIGINLKGGNIHLHQDTNDGKYIHTRYNLILSYPEKGGESIYGDCINTLKERMIWKCVAGKMPHGSKEVLSQKPRTTLSLGFLINNNG
tara:strand:- start:1334 stop:1846 length:513 start_codon:yes stop_codon:yes gene_type:complete